MHQSVRQFFIAFSKQFEGRMPVMYLDTHVPPLVTIGVGNLIDPVSEALGLPFLWKGTTPPRAANADEITSEWNHVKSQANLAHSASSVWNSVTHLFLGDAAIDNLIYQRLDANEAILKRRLPFTNYEMWPADAQLALHSMTWAMGPGFKFPQFELAIMRRDFAAAAAQSHIEDSTNPGLTPRNRANHRLFANAAKVDASQLNPETLYYPQAL